MRYHPPRLDRVDAGRVFTSIQHIVATAYRYHDAMLGRLLQIAGPDATVIVMSDHGFILTPIVPLIFPPKPPGPPSSIGISAWSA